jgi:protein TonB
VSEHLSSHPRPNTRQIPAVASDVQPVAKSPAVAKAGKKTPHSSRLPDLEIENELDDALSDSSDSAPFEDGHTKLRTPDGTSTGTGTAPVLIQESVALDHIIERVTPDYPEDARGQLVQPTLVLDLVVGRDGQVENVSRVDGDTRLMASAAAAVRRWRFAPLIRNGQSVSFESHITLHFARP